MRKDGLRRIDHGRVGATEHVVRVDDHIHAPTGKLLFGHMVVCGGNNDQRYRGMLLAEALAEFLDVFARLVLAVDHDAVGTGFHIGETTFKSVFDGLACDKTFATGNDHEILRDLGALAGTDLFAETLDGVLRLDGVCSEQGILLEADLIFNNHCGHTETFQRTDRKYEVFDFSTRVTVVDNGLGRTFQGIVQPMQTGREVHGLDIGLVLLFTLTLVFSMMRPVRPE